MIISKHNAQILKGIALIVMNFHHFWAYKTWFLPENQPSIIFNENIDSNIGWLCRNCIGIFACITGYAFIKNNKFNNYKYCINKIISFCISYWCIIPLFYIAAILLNEQIPNVNTILLNLLGLNLSIKITCIAFAWYVHFYIFVLLFTPIIRHMFTSKQIINYILFISYHVCCTIYMHHPINNKPLYNIAYFFPFIISGMFIAKTEVNINISPKIRLTMSSIGIIISTILAYHIPTIHNMNIIPIYIILFISSLNSLINITFNKLYYINIFFYHIGKSSMNLWFLSSIFFIFDKKLQIIATIPHNAIIIPIWTAIILLPIAIFCKKIQNQVISYLKNIYIYIVEKQ